MPANRHGPIKYVTINDTRYTTVIEDQPKIDMGGVQNRLRMNSDYSARLQVMPNQWTCDNLHIVVDNMNRQQDLLKEAQAVPDFIPFSFEYQDGAIYDGIGQITGKMIYDSVEGAVQLNAEGGPMVVENEFEWGLRRRASTG